MPSKYPYEFSSDMTTTLKYSNPLRSVSKFRCRDIRVHKRSAIVRRPPAARSARILPGNHLRVRQLLPSEIQFVAISVVVPAIDLPVPVAVAGLRARAGRASARRGVVVGVVVGWVFARDFPIVGRGRYVTRPQAT